MIEYLCFSSGDWETDVDYLWEVGEGRVIAIEAGKYMK